MAIDLNYIVAKCSELKIYEKREVGITYSEIVFYSKDIEQWTDALTEMLGTAVKPEGVDPTKDDLALTMDYGGVFRNQTLFKKDDDTATIIAMFWPWGGGEFTTLKLALVMKKTSSESDIKIL